MQRKCKYANKSQTDTGAVNIKRKEPKDTDTQTDKGVSASSLRFSKCLPCSWQVLCCRDVACCVVVLFRCLSSRICRWLCFKPPPLTPSLSLIPSCTFLSSLFLLLFFDFHYYIVPFFTTTDHIFFLLWCLSTFTTKNTIIAVTYFLITVTTYTFTIAIKATNSLWK